MSKKSQTSTMAQILTKAQQLTNTHLFPNLELLPEDPASETIPKLKEMLEAHKASVDVLSAPFTIYQNNLTKAPLQSVRWLWEKRLPLAGITLLDGDHGCGKSLLALQIAAHVSSGTLMPDGTLTTQGGVVIVTPHTDATTTQLQHLTSLGADLSRVEILSFIQEPAARFHTSGYRPFSLPEDFTCLFEAIKRVNARLVIFDPFISLLSRDCRWTEQRLSHLLTDLNQRLIERNVTCLLIRNCPAKGGHARPSVLERSDPFLTIAVSRLLLAPDPMQPTGILLSHALNRHAELTPTLILRIQKRSFDPVIPYITVAGTHTLQARYFIENRPDTLYRRLLSQRLLPIIAQTTEPTHVTTLYAHFPDASAFQIQRVLSDLLRTEQIQRPARGFYCLTPPQSRLLTRLSRRNKFRSKTCEKSQCNCCNSFQLSTCKESQSCRCNKFRSKT